MKLLVVTCLLALTQVLFAESSFAKNDFWCEPEYHETGVEAVLAQSEGSSQQLAIYTTSSTWGGVDEQILAVEKSAKGNEVTYLADEAILSIQTDQPYGELPEFVVARFTMPNSGIDIGMICEINP